MFLTPTPHHIRFVAAPPEGGESTGGTGQPPASAGTENAGDPIDWEAKYKEALGHSRDWEKKAKANKAAALAQQGMSALEAAALLPSISDEPAPETKVVEMVRPVALGNAALAVQPAPLAVSQPQTEPAPVVDYEARYIAANELALATLKKNRI